MSRCVVCRQATLPFTQQPREELMTRLNAFLLTITAAAMMITFGFMVKQPLVVTCITEGGVTTCQTNSQQPLD